MPLIPNVVQRTSNGERAYDLMSRLLDDRIVMLSEEVTDASASIIWSLRTPIKTSSCTSTALAGL